MAGAGPRVTVAICAYNEAANIGRLLTTLLDRDGDLFDELVVVSSGSTDGTDAIVESYASTCQGLVFIRQPSREGKAAAVNTVLESASGEVVLLVDADCQPAPGSLAALLEHLKRQDAGGVGARNVPVNGDASFVARAGALMWELHHDVNLKRPVLGGDIVGFRRLLSRIPADTINDDYAIEAALRRQGLEIDYAPEARVLMRVPAKLSEFVSQRRRIHAGYAAERDRGLCKSTQQLRLVAGRAALRLVRRPWELPYLTLLTGIELWVRLQALLEDRLGGSSRSYTTWQPATSTKDAVAPEGQ